MIFGILGAAAVGEALAARLIEAGHEVVLANSRGPESLGELVARLGPGAAAGTLEEAASQPIVVLAVPWTRVPGVLVQIGDWDGRILIDATNIFLNYAPDFAVAELGSETGSEIVARLAPGARVVKAFNTLPVAKMFSDAAIPGACRVLFVAGDDAGAKAEVSRTIGEIGLAPVDVGDLRAGGALMQLRGSLSGLDLVKLD